MKEKNIRLVVFILAALILIFIIYKVYKNSKIDSLTAVSGNQNEVSTGNYTDSTSNTSGVLYKGMAGNVIKLLQEEVNSKIRARGSTGTIGVDGAFGNETETAIVSLSGGELSSAKRNITIDAIKSLPNSIATSNAAGGYNSSIGSALITAAQNIYEAIHPGFFYPRNMTSATSILTKIPNTQIPNLSAFYKNMYNEDLKSDFYDYTTAQEWLLIQNKFQ